MKLHRFGPWVPAALALIFILLANRHWAHLGLGMQWQAPFNFMAFIYLAGLLTLAHFNKTYTYRRTNKLRTCVIVPTYNEDPKTFLLMLKSLDKQTLRPHRVHVIDDATSTKACKKVFDEWKKTTKIPEVKYTYRKVNTGKREVQAVGFQADPKADIFVTIDSDTVLDKKAIKNGIRPFGDSKVMSVAGYLVGLNHDTNLLTRLTDLGFVSSFINGRAAWSHLKSVAVNCGGLAFYRASVVRKYLDEYLTQTVFGQKAKSGDDRIMTNFALLEGYAVFQENSIGYTLLPEKLSHLTRQRIRWWRSFFWGGLWLIRRFPMNRLVWWMVTWQFVSFVFYSVIIVALLFSSARYAEIPWGFILYLTLTLAYVRSTRYLTTKIPGRLFKSQLVTFLLAPLSTLLHFFLCSVLQYAGLATVFKMGWGTRKKVEVGVA